MRMSSNRRLAPTIINDCFPCFLLTSVNIAFHDGIVTSLLSVADVNQAFSISYRASCEFAGFRFRIRHSVAVRRNTKRLAEQGALRRGAPAEDGGDLQV